VSTKTWTAQGIPIGSWDALYYKVPIGSGLGTVAANYFMTYFGNINFVLDNTCILLAVCNGDSINTLKFLPQSAVMPLNSTYSANYQTSSWRQAPITASTSLTCGSQNITNGQLNFNYVSGSYPTKCIINFNTSGVE
jgi:hypothetical protein